MLLSLLLIFVLIQLVVYGEFHVVFEHFEKEIDTKEYPFHIGSFNLKIV